MSDSEATQNEVSATQKELRVTKPEPDELILAFQDRINNLTTGPSGFNGLRKSGNNARTAQEDLDYLLSGLDALNNNLSGARRRIERGQALYRDNKEGRLDLVHYDYTSDQDELEELP